MPSQLHEMLLLLFRNRPALAPELLKEALGIELPAYSEVRLESAELTEAVPAEYRADLVVLLVDGKPVLGIVVEVQLKPDARKRFSWPVYVAGLRARLECDCNFNNGHRYSLSLPPTNTHTHIYIDTQTHTETCRRTDTHAPAYEWIDVILFL